MESKIRSNAAAFPGFLNQAHYSKVPFRQSGKTPNTKKKKKLSPKSDPISNSSRILPNFLSTRTSNFPYPAASTVIAAIKKTKTTLNSYPNPYPTPYPSLYPNQYPPKNPGLCSFRAHSLRILPGFFLLPHRPHRKMPIRQTPSR